MKYGNTKFKTTCEKHLFDPIKLKEHFKTRLSISSEVVDPIELKDAQRFVRQLSEFIRVSTISN